MKCLPWLAALCLCASPAWGMDDGDPQTRCGADWLPAYTFASDAEGVTPNGQAMTADVVRLARFCRYGAVRIVAFVGSDLAEAQRRAAWIGRELLADHWPGTRIDLEFRLRNQAPHGMDLRQTFTADAIVEFGPRGRRARRDPGLCPGDGIPAGPDPARRARATEPPRRYGLRGLSDSSTRGGPFTMYQSYIVSFWNTAYHCPKWGLSERDGLI
jgi:hypothetical protein